MVIFTFVYYGCTKWSVLFESEANQGDRIGGAGRQHYLCGEDELDEWRCTVAAERERDTCKYRAISLFELQTVRDWLMNQTVELWAHTLNLDEQVNRRRSVNKFEN